MRLWWVGLCAGLWLASGPAMGAVNLMLLPATQDGFVGETIEVDLLVYSYQSGGETAAGVGAILLWDPDYLELVGYRSDGDYDWLSPRFPDDSGLDGLNAPFIPDGIPANDGDAYFEVWRRLPPADPAYITQLPLLVGTFEFLPTQSGVSSVEIGDEIGDFTRTRVLHGTSPGVEITGTIGPPATVSIEFDCRPPVVEASGSRYLTITPQTGLTETAQALRVTGDPDDLLVSCVSLFVQEDGSLGEEPVYLTPTEWGSISVTGTMIRPDTEYYVEAACGSVSPESLSNSADAITWVWGDVDNDGLARTADMLLVMGALDGSIEMPIEAVDLAGCQPNGIVDTSDLLAALGATGGELFGCASPCNIETFDLEDYAAFYDCLDGPDVEVDASCDRFDLNEDMDVDLQDLMLFHARFWPAG